MLTKVSLLSTYVDQMKIQQRIDILLQLQSHQIFTNVLSICFQRFSMILYELSRTHNDIPYRNMLHNERAKHLFEQ